ncbi:MAG: PIG-L family deacetylase [Acidobacteriota bacterium]|nr:PIG-L family deacetylase [Acidobacteriota bacterium]
MRKIVLSGILLIAFASAHSTAQHQLQPISTMKGAPALELALRKLDTVGSFMMTTAHPDDENNAMLAYFSHGKGFRTTLVTATHGEGGQNEIGPELFEALAVLRTEELLAAHKFDGAEQFFTRAIDFGFSFSIEETLEKWGHQEILGDYVRMIRTIRPDVIVGFVFDGDGGGQHHQTSSRLTLEAFRAAADPTKFPVQLAEGLRVWQPKKFYYTAGFGGPPPGAGGAGGAGRELPGEGAPTLLQFAGGDQFDAVLGRTYNEIAGEARSMHKCQGMSQLLPLPAPTGGGGPMGPGGVRAYRLRDTVLDGGVARPDREVFDGVNTGLRSMLSYAPNAPAELGSLLDRIGAAVTEARSAMAASGESATVAPLSRGLKLVRDLRGALASMGLGESGRYEIDFRLAQKESQFSQAMLLATDVRIDAVARDGLVVPGQPVQVDLMAANRGKSTVDLAIAANGFAPSNRDAQSPSTRDALSDAQSAARSGQACESSTALVPGSSRNCGKTLTIPADARLTAAHFRTGPVGARYVFDPDVPFGLPFRPTPYTATFSLSVENVPFTLTLPVQARSDADIFAGEKRQEIHVVPSFAVKATPEIVIVPTRAAAQDDKPKGLSPQTPHGARDVRVTVTNHAKGAAQAEVALALPQGWRATPPTQSVSFSREDEAMTVKFTLQPPAQSVLAAAAMKPGGNQFKVNALVKQSGKSFEQGYQVVEYPHTTRRHVLSAPQVAVKALDVSVKPNLTVGYVMGVGDEVPAALEQLGVKLSMITPDELAWGDLSRYDVIVTGVRAYERRADLRAYNHRLIDYAKAGGRVIVQYNKFEFNDAQYGPYPAKVGRERVTDENAEMKLLAPQHPVFNSPNAIGRADWAGWVQERGLYFLDTGARDPQYTDLIEFTEPFAYNQGAKRGALVEAEVGKGRWIYVGLGLWRQLPAGTDGAYRLLANLISLP